MNFNQKQQNLKKQIKYDLSKYNSDWINETSSELYNTVFYYQITSKNCNTLKQLRYLIEDAISEITNNFNKFKYFNKVINLFQNQLKNIIKLDMELIYSEDEIHIIEETLSNQQVYIGDNLYNSMIL